MGILTFCPLLRLRQLIPYFFSVFPGDIFAHTRRLEKVDLSRNKLKSLAGVFTDLFGLEEVFLNDNLLLSFSNEWFSNTPNVRTIHLGNIGCQGYN